MTTVTLCRLEELVDGAARRFDVEGARLCVVRIGDDVLCLADRCSHEDFSLALGEVEVDSCEIECARHGAMFSLKDGHPTSFPATRPVARYDVLVEDGRLQVVVS